MGQKPYLRILCCLAALWAACTMAGAPARLLADETHQHAAETPEKLGKVDFPIGCSAEAAAKFQRAVALLHSFVYEEAGKAFADVAATDPSCAMAHWGVAMTLFHPIWAAANPAAAPTPAELSRGREEVQKAKTLSAKTPREKDYIAAVDAFYSGPEAREYAARAEDFAKGMEQVHRNNPQDREAAIFYALALLGTASPNDKTYAVQKKAAEILNAVLPDSPEHPGVAHYLIHSLDYPPLASLALPAARAYSKIAPSSAHALHMPSHIFTRLGLWDESIESNLASAEAARRVVAKAHPGATAFDELHALDYLEYAYLQTGRDKEAKGVLDRIGAVEKLDAAQFAAAYALAAVPARYALERRDWRGAAALGVKPASFPWAKFPYAESLTHFARALGAARSGDPKTAHEAVDRLAAIRSSLAAAKDVYWADQVEIQRRAAAAWVARAEGKQDEALDLMRSAAELEDSTEKHPVTPGPVLPAGELLGDMLLEAGDPAKALAAYEAVLAGSPGRFNGYIGAARAAARSGNDGKARDWYAKLLSLCEHGDGARVEVAEARDFLAKPAPAAAGAIPSR